MSSHFSHLDIREQVQRAQALAEIAITQGLAGYTASAPENDPQQMAGELVGCQEWLSTRFDNDEDELIVGNLIAAARAIGIAQGLRLRPELFAKGSGR